MTDTDTLDAAFGLALGLPEETDSLAAACGHTQGWDSVGRQELMAGILEAFDIAIDARPGVQDERMRIDPLHPRRRYEIGVGRR